MTSDLRLHLRRCANWDAEPVTVAIDMPGDGDPAQEAGDLAALLVEALPEDTLRLLTAGLLTEVSSRLPWSAVLRIVVDAADARERTVR